MNKDEMSDDAHFDAFLRGEGELARRLQAMPQPAPSAELDAAILEKVRASLVPVVPVVPVTPEVRQAANDPVAPGPRLARGLGMRWRVPAGIAATVLVGLFARQSYETSLGAVQVSLPPQNRAEAAIVRESAVPPPAPPAELPMSVQETPQPKPRPQTSAPRVRAPEAVVHADARAVVPPPAPAPASAPPPMAAPPDNSLYKTAPRSASLKANLADTGGLYTAGEWIARMETLVRNGEELAAAREWIIFRQRYPEYAVPADLEAKMKELAKSE